MKLQLALDELNLVDALRFADRVAEYIDIIEIGTPFVMDEGMRGVREFRRFFPDKEILADLKIMDGGYLEAGYAFQAGADYATVCAVSDLLTIEGTARAAGEYDKNLVVDMLGVTDLPARIREIEPIGVGYLAVHTGADAQAAGRAPLEDLRIMTQHVRQSRISVAGGINSRTIQEYAALHPDIVIVGSAIGHAEDPCAEAKAIKEAMQRAEKE